MKRLLFMLVPVVLIVLAFRPIYSHTVGGKITDEKGSAVASSSVVMKGTNISTLSTQDDAYKIVVMDNPWKKI